MMDWVFWESEHVLYFLGAMAVWGYIIRPLVLTPEQRGKPPEGEGE